MKYVIVISDGCADHPLEVLGGRTPLEAAEIPNMDLVAREGTIGTVRTVPEGFKAGSDVAIMSIVGCAPEKYYTGRAPLEAAGIGITLSGGDWAARCNFVTIAGGRMADYSAGHISNEEAGRLVESLREAVGGAGVEFFPGKSYRNLLVLRGAGDLEVATTPPHDIAGKEVSAYLPSGRDAGVFGRLMDAARDVLATHEVNTVRRAEGKGEATDIWLWGEGRASRFPRFSREYGIRAAVITAVDLVGGICALSGWERIVVPGATGYYDTDYSGKADAAAEALKDFDLVLVHVEAPDEASHAQDAENKIRAIENVDRCVVGPLLEEAAHVDGFRMLVMSDHYTLVSSGAHGGEPVPFAMCGSGIEERPGECFSEAAAAGGVRFENGPDLVRTFIG
ncbi:MAG: cofactor-independent phosphoglycerate mutase [Planctomycetes bacterium]|nr:cofactor-independent phosphoglycerate mutase [Planctomycetota bacterium]